MNSESCFRSSSSCFFLFACICLCLNHAFSLSLDVSYTKHCSSIIPPYNITPPTTTPSPSLPLPSLSTPYLTGGDTFSRTQSGSNYVFVQKNLHLRLRDHYQTTMPAVYKVQGFLYLRFPYTHDSPDNYSYSNYGYRRNRSRGSLRFQMNGFWSEESRKLCMVGFSSWRGIDLDSVLKLKFEDANPIMQTSIVSGSLESTASSTNDPAYFDPVLIFSFPKVPNYKYSLVTGELGGTTPSRKDKSLSLYSTEFCSVMEHGLRSLKLEYSTEFTAQPHHPLFAPFLSLTSIQCLKGDKMAARFVATFQNYSSYGFDTFSLGSTVIGEALWDDKNNRVIGVACEILNPINHWLENAVGNCSIRLSLRHPPVLTIRNDAKIVGEIWSSKAQEDSGYFNQISLTATAENRGLSLPDQRYEYTEVDRAEKSCAATKKVGKKGSVYPDGHSYDMRFDMNIKNNKGKLLGWATAIPAWVGNESYQSGGGGDMVLASAPYATMVLVSDSESADVIEPQKSSSILPTNMSYRIRIYPYYDVNTTGGRNVLLSSLGWPVSRRSSGVVITAEGVYDIRNGHLCMVGCRNLLLNSTSTFKDCDVVVELDVPPLNGEGGGLAKGILRSTRPKTDTLHFDDLILESAVYYRGEAARSIWRMDLEIAMVLISNTLLCIFIALQIFHVKRNPEVPSFVSLVMLVILSVGHMIPLVLNFEAVFLGNLDKNTLELGSGGRLEANEVAVRVITMVAMLLQLRLLQLVFTSKQSESNQKSSSNKEKKAGFVSLTLYTIGGLLTLLINWMRKPYFSPRYSVWGDLRSYAGLILDGFLLPQILLNIFSGSKEKALSRSFYIGTSGVRLVPHAYNQYRSHNYPKNDLNATYYYANPAGDMYSTAWDIVIPLGVIALAVIVFMQQRHGGRCILPLRFRALEMYEKVPSTDDQ